MSMINITNHSRHNIPIDTEGNKYKDTYKSFICRSIAELKKYGETIVFSKEHIQELEKVFPGSLKIDFNGDIYFVKLEEE